MSLIGCAAHPVNVEMYFFFISACAETSHNEVPVASYSEELTLLAATRSVNSEPDRLFGSLLTAVGDFIQAVSQ